MLRKEDKHHELNKVIALNGIGSSVDIQFGLSFSTLDYISLSAEEITDSQFKLIIVLNNDGLLILDCKYCKQNDDVVVKKEIMYSYFENKQLLMANTGKYGAFFQRFSQFQSMI